MTMKNNNFDEEFTKAEIDLIDKLIAVSIKKKNFISEETLMKMLK